MTDYLRGTQITRGLDVVVGPSAGITPMYQQFNMVQGLQGRFKSSLYDLKTLVHADLLDSELQAAEELSAKGFQRGAGAVAGVVLEAHLSALCERRGIAIPKKNPTISDFNDALKGADIIEISTWRFIQHLGDIRNKCDHSKSGDPTKIEVTELIDGVKKVTKTIL
jgi:hypothetical protein